MKTISQFLDQSQRAIYSVSPDDTVREALEVMALHNIGALLMETPSLFLTPPIHNTKFACQALTHQRRLRHLDKSQNSLCINWFTASKSPSSIRRKTNMAELQARLCTTAMTFVQSKLNWEWLGTTSSMSRSSPKKIVKFMRKLSFLHEPMPSDFGRINSRAHLGNLESSTNELFYKII